jgi:mRNA interferase RelE/StbE
VNYTIRLTRPAQKTLDGLEGETFARIVRALRGLEANPRPPGVVKMSGPDDHWRIRVGDWRIVYAIYDRELVVLVVKLGHRREIYR